ncbi:hypothetical protein HYDPIDRAFT_96195 [Hydnomerulius pinastri MD-312]|uniref:CUE domain-containing protein n=1 Tax=Hydnomerulius pinastri MD-312 TaxID=994086 RepID=A0A0C9WC10_9AGAM|nr:hypothetical protein HYDPIDRAFT_96195 [Hydnomerulius pinastri MD-312]
MTTLAPLPIYPSAQARKEFSASQLAQFHLNVSNALGQVITLPPAKRDTPANRAFISSYASDSAYQVLQGLIWENTEPAKGDDNLRQRILLLSEKLASLAPGLETRTLLDLCVAFPHRITRLKAVFAAALGGTPSLPSTFSLEIVPSFTTLLSPSQSSGLYGLRKTARCLLSLLRPVPPELIRPFAHSKDFILALARAYDEGLNAISQSYGGMRADISNRELDDWERIWMETKIDLVDCFHIIVTAMVKDITAASGAQLAVEADRAFGIIFALLDITPQYGQLQPANPRSAAAVPFLNRTLVADYQHAYDLQRTLASALRHVARSDSRLDALESILCSLDVESLSANSAKDAGALKLLLRSSGIPPKQSHKHNPAPPVSKGKGKSKATTPDPAPAQDPDIDLKVTQVLDIFPDHSPGYIHKLLEHPSFPFRGNAEKVIEALLEGTAPGEDELQNDFTDEFPGGPGTNYTPLNDAPIERRNVFDDEIMDLKQLHVGKKNQDETIFTRDRAEIERMKADILRRAEVMSDESDEEGADRGRGKALDVVDLDDDFDEAGGSDVKVIGDGEGSGDEDGEERGVDPTKPETILELAYIREPRLFDRDGTTRRSKARADLKTQTGWSDEQIEGWRIMLERNPKKDRILQKHEFAGNRVEDAPAAESSGDSNRPPSEVPGRGRGRGVGGGRGRGRGRGGGGGGPSDGTTRDRAFKDKNKASRANHNRKRGHDKKMARAGAGPSA